MTPSARVRRQGAGLYTWWVTLHAHTRLLMRPLMLMRLLMLMLMRLMHQVSCSPNR